MFGTDLEERLGMGFVTKTGKRIGATQRKGILPSQIVPKLFKLDGGIYVAVGPEQGDHFSERGNVWWVAVRGDRSPGNYAAHAGSKSKRIGLAIAHESGEGFGSVQSDIAALGNSPVQV